ncbi:hypothetical protein Sviol_54800 [Streptomyces violascens]|uniref:Uncharacterized protein n=1 Tax=Streptomyces violascens TaxID=67381 RepID=A0ABQ3QUZ5_9ACTN|nr:hypothetical protein Sviol_54800 [Streptomyces violascens]
MTAYLDDHTDRPPLPGQSGPTATTEADPHDVGTVRMGYAPDRDGDPDPGEIVWTWVPFEENSGLQTRYPPAIQALTSGNVQKTASRKYIREAVSG